MTTNLYDKGAWRVKAQYAMSIDGHQIVAYTEAYGRRDYHVLQSLPVQMPDQRVAPEQGVMLADKDLLQAFLDCAWGMGLRPTGYSDVHEAMKASDAHLQDMRAIVFNGLWMKDPAAK